MSAPPAGVITLLTDFGLSDPFVGIMKGVIVSAFPSARIIDLCHGIAPQSVPEAAFWLERSFGWFPVGSVHVVVVDPGVGSARRIVALATTGHYFLAPDNGSLAPSLLSSPGASVREVDVARHGLEPRHATFHGRDVFAPVAARLASGSLAFASLGDRVEPRPCVLEPPVNDGEHITGAVITIDRFGNLITNLGQELIHGVRAPYVSIGGHAVRVVRTYADAQPGELIALVNAFDVIEIAVRDGSAERQLGLGRHTPVRLPLSLRPLPT
jgi:S-adenosyl-L-methionine hydrolase (adenosine-forming)